MTKRKIEYWVIPPEKDAEFVACMEEVLETYAEAYDPQRPVLVYCAGGYRSILAASLLASRGFTDVSDLLGGYGAWAAASDRA